MLVVDNKFALEKIMYLTFSHIFFMTRIDNWLLDLLVNFGFVHMWIS